jgi:putative hydrolase of the HAD superfamily
LETLKVREFFEDENIYGVDDVMPVCKPEPAAFRKVLKGIGCDDPTKAVMYEDSMKNVRAAKGIGMKTGEETEARVILADFLHHPPSLACSSRHG